ncbi:MAG: M20 family metallopeptidase, partial [Candidatus Ranarchaeia archaeon]
MHVPTDWRAALSEIAENQIVDYLKRLVKIRSIVGKESSIGSFLYRTLRRFARKVEKVPVSDAGPCLIATIGDQSDSTPAVLIGGHMDTVPVCQGWRSNPFTPMVRKGRLYGLGAYDMKAGLACALATFEALSKSEHLLEGRLNFLALSDEEGWSRGVNTVIDKKLLAGVVSAIIAEPSGLDRVKIGRCGRVLYRLVIQGRSSHVVSGPSKNNAILIAALILNNLRHLPVMKDKNIGLSSNVTPLSIHSGTKVLSHPDECQITLDYHYLPTESIGKVTTNIKHFIEKLGLSG